MRRFTRLTNGLFKKVENHAAGGRATLHSLQLCEDSQIAQDHASNGGWDLRSRLVTGRNCSFGKMMLKPFRLYDL